MICARCHRWFMAVEFTYGRDLSYYEFCKKCRRTDRKLSALPMAA